VPATDPDGPITTRGRPLRRWRLPAIGLATVLLAAGCATGTKQTIFDPKGPNAQKIANLDFVYWLAIAVALAVFAVVGVAMWRFRERKHADQPIPKQIHGNSRLEIMWTIAPAVLLAIIAVPTVVTVFQLAKKTPDSLEVTVVGQQWWWEFDYPSLKNDTGQPIVTANELVIPAGKPVELSITSRDVIHSFWIPALNGKRDAVPNRVQPLRMQADKPGEFWGQCTEFCGLSHANMRIRVKALDDADWQKWIQNQLLPGATPQTDQQKAGQTTFLAQCSRCHQINGLKDAQGNVVVPNAASQVVPGAVPNLTHFMSRTTFAGASFNLKLPECTNPAEYSAQYVTGTSDQCLNRADLERWLRNPPAALPMAVSPPEPDGRIRGMPDLHLTEQQIDDLVAYLSSLK
jgi:cytochrome c oxidase subunit 2